MPSAVSSVALLAEGVDRNVRHRCPQLRFRVALLAEGVDRNDPQLVGAGTPQQVALLAEGVDRNYEALSIQMAQKPSPSSRRAWIEI